MTMIKRRIEKKLLPIFNDRHLDEEWQEVKTHGTQGDILAFHEKLEDLKREAKNVAESSAHT